MLGCRALPAVSSSRGSSASRAARPSLRVKSSAGAIRPSSADELRRLDIRGRSLWSVDTGLRDKRVLVTGASGGIGSACARAFFAEGCRVAVHYHEGLERAEALSEELGGAPIFRADLRVEDEVDALFQDAVEELGGLDVCAAVAGTVAGGGRASLGAAARALGGDASGEPDGDVPDRSRVPARGRARAGTGRSSWSARRRGCSARRAMPTTRRRSQRSSVACCCP